MHEVHKLDVGWLIGGEVLFVGDDWSEDRHDVELVDPAGARLAKAGLPEGVAGSPRCTS